MTSSTTLWYLTRGSGAVALVLLTASVVLGVVTALRVHSRRWPRFAVGALHKNLTLLSIAFVALHVVTTVADGYAPIGLKDAIVPFASPYRPIWLGLGAVAFDLLLALVITSYLRHRIGARMWRGIHWLAYVSWPVALVHSFGTGSDPSSTWLVALGGLCVAAVVVAVLARVAAAVDAPRVRIGGAAAALVLPAILVVWWATGPARPGWAAKAGTPTHLMASHRHVTTAPPRVLTSETTATAPRSFSANANGTIVQQLRNDGTTAVVIRLKLDGGPGGALRIDLHGQAVPGGVAMTASGVSFVPATTRAIYYGNVTELQGNLVDAVVRDHAGDRLRLALGLTIDQTSNSASAQISAITPGQGDGE
jgi:DMSO/TMAO reductase YedYZ heme-binding membrane subunit